MLFITQASPVRRILAADRVLEEILCGGNLNHDHKRIQHKAYRMPIRKDPFVIAEEPLPIAQPPPPPLPGGGGGRRRSSLMEIGTRVIDVSKDLGRSVREAADGELKEEVIQFGRSTTAHGIPLALAAKKWTVRAFWIWLSIISFSCFFYQCTLVFEKFQRKEKLVNVEMHFESAPFPAITVCNLNPFKRHLAKTVPEISDTLDAFHQAVTFSKDAFNHYAVDSKQKRSATFRPGGFRYVQYEPVFSHCSCPETGTDCVQYDSVPLDDRAVCICNYDRQDSSAWPCFNSSSWHDAMCPECNDIGYCNLPETIGTDRIPCVCQQDVKYCLIRPDRLKRIWEFRGTRIPDEDSPFREDFLKQLKDLGYENMTDEVAITTTTKEKMVFMMAELPVHRRIALSYGKSEFIQMCSFNGKQCNIISDFKLHVDPTFGNCYTFNANKQGPLISSRAGPSYGLRLMVFVNASDYLPTTEATGVRIAIHDPRECPFPDTFGYSAPTGFVSSFGLSMRKVHRLKEPIGNCVLADQPLPPDYIFRQYKYEPEASFTYTVRGCYKSCYQNHLIGKCGCADPRYPIADNHTQQCSHHDELSLECLLHESTFFTRKNDCNCRSPCERDVYTTTYSSAKWPSGSFQVGECGPDVDQCIAYYSANAVMLEVYYEQMSYEILTEAESYLFVNLISDIGGQAGLWLGASVITICECFVFMVRILTIYCRKPKNLSPSTATATLDSEQGVINATPIITNTPRPMTKDPPEKLANDIVTKEEYCNENNLNSSLQQEERNIYRISASPYP